jgi:acetyl-CoA carboxylase biotin carboxylase subunit
MIGKLITFGVDRKTAIERMHRALGEFIIRGIKTTIPFHRAILSDPLFCQGEATTAFVQDFLNRTPPGRF